MLSNLLEVTFWDVCQPLHRGYATACSKEYSSHSEETEEPE